MVESRSRTVYSCHPFYATIPLPPGGDDRTLRVIMRTLNRHCRRMGGIDVIGLSEGELYIGTRDEGLAKKYGLIMSLVAEVSQEWVYPMIPLVEDEDRDEDEDDG